jgi:AraC-like DNA-binding protein
VGVDALAGLLEGPRAREAFLLRSVMDPPWSLRIEDEAPLTLVAVVRGEAWIVPDDGEPTVVSGGGVALVRGPGHYDVADAPDREPLVVIHPGQVCTTVAGDPLVEAMALGVRTWGNSPDGSTVLLTGTYQHRSELSARLLDALPPVVTLPADAWESPLVGLLAEEITRDDPGQEAVLDRLLDLLLIAVLRAWFARAGDEAPAWYRAYVDPVVGRALRLLLNNPAHGWTVGLLASEVGVSRAALARRFHALVGEPPMAFLTSWRLAMAADLLGDADVTLGAVARQVGYGSPYALSAAFKRVRGVSPRDHRSAVAVAAAG